MSRLVCDACDYGGQGLRLVSDDRACPQCGEMSRIRTAFKIDELSDQEAKFLCDALEESVAQIPSSAAER